MHSKNGPKKCTRFAVKEKTWKHTGMGPLRSLKMQASMLLQFE